MIAIAVVLGLLLAVGAASVGVAAATLSQLELTRWVQYRLRRADAAAQVRDNPARLVTTANALATLGLVLAAGALPAVWPGAGPIALGAGAVAIAIPGFLVLTYLLPRQVGRHWAEGLTTRALPWMDRAARWLAPFLPHRDPSPRSALAAMVSGSDTATLTTANELAVVAGVLAFTDRPVREVMTPRTGIVAIPEGMLAGEAAHLFAQAGYSRYPVYRGTLDDVIGVVHAFDLLKRQPEEPVPVRPVVLVPGTTLSGDVLREMRHGRGHLAVVLDEYGGTAGLVTFDDLLRNLVTELFPRPPAPGDVSEGQDVVELDGSAPATVLAERFGATIDARDVRTVAGLLAQHLGRIPRTGERFLLQRLEFDVLQASATRVERLAVRRGPGRTVSLDEGGDA